MAASNACMFNVTGRHCVGSIWSCCLNTAVLQLLLLPYFVLSSFSPFRSFLCLCSPPAARVARLLPAPCTHRRQRPGHTQAPGCIAAAGSGGRGPGGALCFLAGCPRGRQHAHTACQASKCNEEERGYVEGAWLSCVQGSAYCKHTLHS